MTDVLEVVGLAALVAAGFLFALWAGFLVLGVGCLVASWSVTRKRREAIELDRARRALQVPR